MVFTSPKENPTNASCSLCRCLTVVQDLFYSAWIIPSACLPTLAEKDAFLDISQNVTEDPDFDWEDVTTSVQRTNAVYNGKVAAIPLDGDLMLVYYRKDILSESNLAPPATWEHLLALVELFNGTDMDGDGQGDYGTCLGWKSGRLVHPECNREQNSRFQEYGGSMIVLPKWALMKLIPLRGIQNKRRCFEVQGSGKHNTVVESVF